MSFDIGRIVRHKAEIRDIPLADIDEADSCYW
jgi:hypothetical protein